MKCNAPKNNNKAFIERTKFNIVSARDKENVNQAYIEAYDEIFNNVRNDIVEQVMATCLYELNKEFGFGKDRLTRFFNGVSSMFLLMRQGIMGKEFNTDDCIKFCSEHFGIKIKIE